MNTEIKRGQAGATTGDFRVARVAGPGDSSPRRLPASRGVGTPGRAAASSLAAIENPVRMRFGAFELDETNARLLRDGRPLAVAPRPFAVLCELVRAPGSLVPKNALLDAVK